MASGYLDLVASTLSKAPVVQTQGIKMNNPITTSCMRSVLEKQSVRRTNL
jgi:hypothetical protein